MAKFPLLLLPLLLSSCVLPASCQDIDQGVLDEVFGGLQPNRQNDPSGPPAPPVTSTTAAAAPFVTSTTPSSGDREAEPCQTPEGVDGLCVPYYLCSLDNNTVISDGTGIIDIRVRDGPCQSYMDTCCLSGNQRAPDDPVTPAPVPEERTGCGWRNPDGVGFRITGGKDGEANFAEFPWMVAVLTIELVNEEDPEGQKLNVYAGGGSLIHTRVVLTAAHVVSKAWKVKPLRARAGEWDTQTKQEAYPYQDRDVNDVVMHKDFNSGNLFYDVALLFLDRDMELAPNVALVCLPPPGELVPGGARCYTSGWGKDQFEKEGRYQVILKRVEVPVVDNQRCQAQLRRTRLGAVFQLHSSFMCAGGEVGKDACKGDGGSPLVCPVEFEPGRFMQSGIVAWGIGCGQDGTPGVYVSVAKLRDWIDNAVAGRQLSVTDYVA